VGCQYRRCEKKQYDVKDKGKSKVDGGHVIILKNYEGGLTLKVEIGYEGVARLRRKKK
jgi:hypothetical protein